MSGFRTFHLPHNENLFEELLTSVQFVDVGKGRQGAVLTKPNDSYGIPIVRTTTSYGAPTQGFRPVHDQLAQQIQDSASLSAGFNNALIETYTDAYTTMGSHSDQALDLASDSFIAVFSCYRHPDLTSSPRKLVVESKKPGADTVEIPLAHNTVIVFSADSNRKFKHRIVLAPSSRNTGNQWLGVTFRTSKTFVRFRDERAYFMDDTRLTLASIEQRHEFYRLRHQENNETEFVYPRITYTLSESDLMPPDLAIEPGAVKPT